MSISHMAFVTCDGCGQPAGGNDDMRDGARVARKRARDFGFQHYRSMLGDPEPRRSIDLCPTCRQDPTVLHWLTRSFE